MAEILLDSGVQPNDLMPYNGSEWSHVYTSENYRFLDSDALRNQEFFQLLGAVRAIIEIRSRKEEG